MQRKQSGCQISEAANENSNNNFAEMDFAMIRECFVLQVKHNELTMAQAEILFQAWKMRYQTGMTHSFKRKQVSIWIICLMS